ncbi:MAG: hypothetical protein PHO30_03580 [Candidatus Omnitrophica bacterium]|nr:hypothetical protein [Candidatus Omnitrophota bacterium]
MQAFSLQDKTALRAIMFGILLEVLFALLLGAICWLIACALQFLFIS